MIVAADVRMVKVACASQHTVALRDNGEVWCWGAGQQLGINCSDVIRTPRKVSLLAGRNVLDISCGAQHTLVVVQKLSLFNPSERR